MIPLRSAGLRLAAVVPVLVLVVIAGVMAFAGLAFRAAGRDYAQRACQAVLLAACALMAGRSLDLSALHSAPGGMKREAARQGRAAGFR